MSIGAQEMVQSALGLMSIAVLMLLAAALLPSPKWLAEVEQGRAQGEARIGRKRLWRVLFQAAAYGLIAVVGVIALQIFTGLPALTAVVLSIGIVGLIVPLVNQNRAQQRQKQGRREAVAIASSVVGQLNARATLPDALAQLVHEHETGRRRLAVTYEGLATAVQAINAQQDLYSQMIWLADLYEEIPELNGLWKNYAIIAQGHFGAKANIAHADDIAKSLRLMDELKNTLATELSTSVMTRLTMFLLITGLISYLIFQGGSLGEVLVSTLAGNLLILFALLMLYIANWVGSRLEKMPLLRF